MITYIHSGWAYIVLLAVIIATANVWIKKMSGATFTDKDFRLALFALITMHIQFLIGLVNYFTTDYFSSWSELGVGGVMKNSLSRQVLIEHPTVAILSIVLITIGWSKHKKTPVASKKFNAIAIFYTLALLLLLSRIPWKLWWA